METLYQNKTEHIEKLVEQLNDNHFAIKRLKVKEEDIRKGHWHYGFLSTQKRINLLKWNLKVQQRVHRMRFRILENLSAEISKEKQQSSSATRHLKTQAA